MLENLTIYYNNMGKKQRKETCQSECRKVENKNERQQMFQGYKQ